MTQQSDRQATVRAATGTALPYEGDWHALFDQASIPAGPFNHRLLNWINGQLASTHNTLDNAMQHFAGQQGAFNWSSMGAFTIGGGSYGPEATALFAAMTVQPNPARKTLINNLITALIAAGVWAKMDRLWVCAAHDVQAGRLNWIAPATDILVANGGPIFTVDQGFAGDGIGAYMATTYAPGFGGVQAQQNNHHLGCWCLLPNAFAAMPSMGNNFFSMHHLTASLQARARSAFTAPQNCTLITDTSVGHIVVNRAAGASFGSFQNGVSLGAQAIVSAAPTNFPIVLLALNSSGTIGSFNSRKIAVAHAGFNLTAQNISDLYAALSTFLVALGN